MFMYTFSILKVLYIHLPFRLGFVESLGKPARQISESESFAWWMRPSAIFWRGISQMIEIMKGSFAEELPYSKNTQMILHTVLIFCWRMSLNTVSYSLTLQSSVLINGCF